MSKNLFLKVELYGESNVSQLLSIVLPNIDGYFVVDCEAKTFLFNHSVSSSINMTINAGDSAVCFILVSIIGNTFKILITFFQKIASDKIIIIVFAIVLLLVIVVAILLTICYFCGCLLFSKKEKKTPDQLQENDPKYLYRFYISAQEMFHLHNFYNLKLYLF
jgi:hypothetical protein